MTTNKDLSFLKWVGILLAFLSTVFTLTIVGSHLSGRLVGWGRIGIIGSVGAELMTITCAWLIESKRKRVALVAMLCQLVLTGMLLVNASIAIDLDWQETRAEKEVERQIVAQKQVEEEKRRTLDKTAELALQLAEKDRRLARAFVREGTTPENEASAPKESTDRSLALPQVHKLTFYERYGLTVFPLFLALLTLIALSIAAQGGDDVYGGEDEKESSAINEGSAADNNPVRQEDQITEFISENGDSDVHNDGRKLNRTIEDGVSKKKAGIKGRVRDSRSPTLDQDLDGKAKQKDDEQAAQVIILSAAHRKGPLASGEQLAEQSAQWLKSLLPEASNGSGWWEVRAKNTGYALMFRWRDPDLRVLTVENISYDQIEQLKNVNSEGEVKGILRELILVGLHEHLLSPAKSAKAKIAAEKLGFKSLIPRQDYLPVTACDHPSVSRGQ